ncbi:MAG TPA: TonB-dependent receptor [Croceibacterium sp.]
MKRRSNGRKLLCAALLGTSMLAISSPARAQSPEEEAGASEQAAGDAPTDDTIVVTGQFQNSLTNRIPVAPEELPFTLDTLDREAIDQRNFVRSLEVIATLPNVVSRDRSTSVPANEFMIRGSDATKLTNNRPQSFARGAGDRDDSFIDRVEVLKGPPTIAIGPAIPGGIVNIITKSPTAENFLAFDQTFNSMGISITQFDANAASLFGSEQVRARVMGSYRGGEGQADGDKVNNVAVRGVIEAELAERTRVQASAALIEIDSRAAIAAFPLYEDGTIPEVFGPTTSSGGGAPQDGSDLYLDGELQHEFLDSLKLTLRGSYQDTSFEYRDLPGVYNYAGPGILFSDPVVYMYRARGGFDEQVTYGDAQLAGDFGLAGERQDWVIGATYHKTESSQATGYLDPEVYRLDELDGLVLPPVDYAQIDPGNPYVDVAELVSVYAELALRPLGGVTVLGGLRYDWLENRAVDPTDPSTADEVQEVGQLTGRLGASVELTDGINAYASYAGSFVPQPGRTRTGLVGPETAVNYELGLKGRLGSMTLETALFRLLRQNRATGDPTNAIDENFVVATGEERYQGLEISLSGELVEGLTLQAGLGLVDAEVTEDNTGLEGTTPPQTAELTFSLWGQYAFGGTLEGLRIGGGLRGVGDRAQAPGLVIDSFPGYEVVDALLAYRVNERLDLQLNVFNLTDERYLDSIGFNGQLAGGYNFGAPRSVSVTASLRL